MYQLDRARSYLILTVLSIGLVSLSLQAQSNFRVEDYYQFLQENENLSAKELIDRHSPRKPYFSHAADDTSLERFAFIDSLLTYYDLTRDELNLLKNHHFVVTERLSFGSFGEAFHDVYANDLPVFISTDAILQALHRSYDQILMDIELAILTEELSEMLDLLSSRFPQLLAQYQSTPDMHGPLADVDIYITMAKALLADDKTLVPQFADKETFSSLWDAIEAEQYVEMPLFSETRRKLDFSQFTVRGHYTQREELGRYFKAMMWLGRTDFLLSPAPGLGLTEEDLRRMTIGAVLLVELLDQSGAWEQLNAIDDIIGFMVGESDNLTPGELAEIVTNQSIQGADDLLNDSIYGSFQDALYSNPSSGQRILSDIFIMDPYSSEPDPLPISFRFMGQRFIVDSYVFSNVVYDRIVYNGEKIWRPMPDPLDAMFVIGNDDALPLLHEELTQYKYAGELSALRYLVDAFDQEFWSSSLYNVWLEAIRLLNPPQNDSGLPFFMRTVAWHQQKLNTQLASWAQLRHDNLLYAKQSYTGGTVCSFPHSYVEPYPAFYREIANFAAMAGDYFGQYDSGNNYLMRHIVTYFDTLETTVSKLERLAQKEIDREPFNEAEEDFLKRMLFIDAGSGAPPFSGWYANLFYTIEDAAKWDFLVADVHTQPTDRLGGVVGRILHVGVGEVNLGIFLAESASCEFVPMVFVGPVLSYYEKITEGFDRLTDERWKELVQSGHLPPRPDWVNVYLAHESGARLSTGRQLHGRPYYVGIENESPLIPATYALHQNYPNPFNPSTSIEFSIPRRGLVTLTVLDLLGREIGTILSQHKDAGRHKVQWDARDAPTGVYFVRMVSGGFSQTRKVMVLR